MDKLRIITLATVMSILGLGSINVSLTDAANEDDKFVVWLKQENSRNIVAQKPAISTEDELAETDDEMIDALQNRQKKLEKLEILKKITQNKQIIETLNQKNFNVQNTEELTNIKEIVNNQNLADKEIINLLKDKQIGVNNLDDLESFKAIVNNRSLDTDESEKLSQMFTFRMLVVGIPAVILVFLIGTPIVKGIISNISSNVEEKIGKPKVPEGSVTLHNKSFKEITVIGTKAESINNNKFSSEEFKQLIQFNVNVSKKTEGYLELKNSVELLKAAIIAQKSFLKLESTELRYRSRKQQEFYKYIADNLEGEIDQEAFAKKVKKKQAEIIPLINTEEGRSAIKSYIKELNILSQYELGLKLLALFKQYDLQDFSILRNISDVVESLQVKELMSPQDLVSLVLENYEYFEKLAPILGISKEQDTAKGYARVLQILGLMNRHGKSYIEFENLVEQLKKWEKPYKHISMVRKEYTAAQFAIPSEFKEDIPGINVYRQYAEYLPDL